MLTSSQHAAGKYNSSDEAAGTGRLFPPSLAPGVMAAFEKAGVQATYLGRWSPTLRAFLDGLVDD